MKKLLVSLLSVGFFFFTSFEVLAQDLRNNQVPSLILNSFKSEFPKASDIDWEREGSNFEVEFEVGRRDHKALFNDQGQLIRHEQELRVRNLPEHIRREILKTHRGYRISEVDKL